MDISPIFNIADIFQYFESYEEIKDNLDYPKRKIENVKKDFDKKISKSTRGKDYRE